MSFLKRIGLTIGVILLLLTIVAIILPSAYHAEKVGLVSCTPDEAFDSIDDVRAWPQWTVWSPKHDESLKYSFPGPDKGVGATAAWTSDQMGDGRRVVTVTDKPTRFEFDLYFQQGSEPAHSTMLLSATSEGTKIHWSMDGDMGFFLPGRLMRPLMEKMVESAYHDSLRGLDERCSKSQQAAKK